MTTTPSTTTTTADDVDDDDDDDDDADDDAADDDDDDDDDDREDGRFRRRRLCFDDDDDDETSLQFGFGVFLLGLLSIAPLNYLEAPRNRDHSASARLSVVCSCACMGHRDACRPGSWICPWFLSSYRSTSGHFKNSGAAKAKALESEARVGSVLKQCKVKGTI